VSPQPCGEFQFFGSRVGKLVLGRRDACNAEDRVSIGMGIPPEPPYRELVLQLQCAVLAAIHLAILLKSTVCMLGDEPCLFPDFGQSLPC
jgi:hypothetical protein